VTFGNNKKRDHKEKRKHHKDKSEKTESDIRKSARLGIKYPFGKEPKKKIKVAPKEFDEDGNPKSKSSRPTMLSAIAAQKAQEMSSLLDQDA
jgi:hypothetical protein